MANLRKVKRLAQRRHFSRRADERLGYHLSGREISQIRNTIQSGELEPVARPGRQIRLYPVRINGRRMVVVYDTVTKELVTLLTQTIWQSQKMCKSPDVKDESDLRESIENTPMGVELRKLGKNGS